MHKFELIAPCHFGLESVLKKEIIDLGYEISQVEDGKVSFFGDEKAICRANIFLRTAERVLIKIAKFKAITYDELFESVKAIEWDKYIPEDGKFWVTKASSIKSQLFSPSDIQRIVKKAMVESLKPKYNKEWFEETGSPYPLRVFFMKDEALITLDTTGDSLHKRGYRQFQSLAPISETLAAALILLTPWNKDRILVDPFCGSGTFLIEAAMLAANIAPGIKRTFISRNWGNLIEKKLWKESYQEAESLINKDIEVDIQGYDIDGKIIRDARKNAALAGVEELIHFQERALANLSHPKKYGFIITNPPYGERLEDKADLVDLYAQIGERYKSLDSWSAYIITSYENAEKDMGIKANKNRKIYNGMIKTYYYQFMGPKPPARNKSGE